MLALALSLVGSGPAILLALAIGFGLVAAGLAYRG